MHTTTRATDTVFVGEEKILVWIIAGNETLSVLDRIGECAGIRTRIKVRSTLIPFCEVTGNERITPVLSALFTDRDS
jgi:hypothetical protein